MKPNNVYYTNDQLIQMLQDHTKKLGRTSVRREFPENQAVVSHFGSWKKGLEVIGVLKNKVVQEAASELGAAFTKRQYQMWAKNNSALSINIIQRELRCTFNDLKRKLGLIENAAPESLRVLGIEKLTIISKDDYPPQYYDWLEKQKTLQEISSAKNELSASKQAG